MTGECTKGVLESESQGSGREEVTRTVDEMESVYERISMGF